MNELYSSTGNSFSFARVFSLFTFYGYSVKRQLLTYIIASIIVTILLLIPASSEIRIGLFTMGWTILQWMCYLSPLSLAKSGYTGNIDRILPVKASEKLVYYVLYFLVILPIALFTLPICAEYYILQQGVTNEFTAFIQLQLYPGVIIRCLNKGGYILCVIVCLYYVIKSRNNKALYGALSAIICQIVLGFVGAIMGAMLEFSRGFMDGYMNREPTYPAELNEFDATQVISLTKDLLQPSVYTYTTIGILVVAIFVFTSLLYKRLRKPVI